MLASLPRVEWLLLGGSVPVLGHLAAPQLHHGGEHVHQAGGLGDDPAGRQHPGPAEYPRHADPAFPAAHAFAACVSTEMEKGKRLKITRRCLLWSIQPYFASFKFLSVLIKL